MAQDEHTRIGILLVDDRQENLVALEAILEHPDYRLVKANSGDEALKCVLKEEFAAILLDVQMPGLDGFETAALIHRRKRSRHVPILFITALNKEDGYVFRGYSLGAVDYIFKPVDPDVLRAKVGVFAELYRKGWQIRLQAEQLLNSERRDQERELTAVRASSESRYRHLADAIPQMVWATDLKGTVTYVNQRWIDYFGTSPIGTRFGALRAVAHTEDFLATARALRKAARTVLPVSVEVRLCPMNRKDHRWHLLQLVPEHSALGTVEGWLGTATDIHDQKRLEHERAHERERLATTLRCIADGVITTDLEGRVVLINKAAELLTGWLQSEAQGTPITQVLDLRVHPGGGAVDSPLTVVFDEGAAIEEEHCAYLRSRAGVDRLVAKKSAPIWGPSNEPVGAVVVFQDITERRRMEEEQQKASRLESIGILAGSIAHDFNNILTAIMGNISLAKLYATQGDNVYERLSEAEKAALWARDLTQQLLTFSKGGSPVRQHLDLAALVEEAANFATRGARVSCRFSIEDRLHVEADESQLRQVIHNLVLNAQQAMPEGGEVRIGVRKVRIGRDRDLPLAAGEYAEMTCRDVGVGIPPENISKIFDPYFTTKQRGSGLGLATSYSIIKRHEGLIRVESRVGRGSCFFVYLPLSSALAPRQASEIVVPEPAHSTARILVMDDDVFIRELLRRLLRHFGYQCEFAEEGQVAVQLYGKAQQEGHPFDVVIMDLVIPGGMGGQEAVKEILQLNPEARVIVSSGYSSDPVMAHFRQYGFCEALAKPYKNEEVRQAVARALARRYDAQGDMAKAL